MAKTHTLHVPDMSDADLPDGTAIYVQVRDPNGDVAAYAAAVIVQAAFDADNAQWRLDNPNQIDPTLPPFAAVVDPASPTTGERLFMQSRFMKVSSEGGQMKKHPADWAQLNATNFSAADITAGKVFLKAIYDAQRIFEGLTPPV